MAGDLSLCICLCDREVPLVMSPVFQATGWQIVHILVWPHLLLSFAYSGDPLPTHCSTKFTTVLRGQAVKQSAEFQSSSHAPIVIVEKVPMRICRECHQKTAEHQFVDRQ